MVTELHTTERIFEILKLLQTKNLNDGISIEDKIEIEELRNELLLKISNHYLDYYDGVTKLEITDIDSFLVSIDLEKIN